MTNFELVLYYNKKSISNPNQKSKTPSYVIIEEDENFIDNIKEIEQKSEFISWTKTSKFTIETTLEIL